MTSVRLTTNAEWLRPEICDVIRLFLGDIVISADEGEIEINHVHEESGLDCKELAESDGKVFEKSYSLSSETLEDKRRVKRAAKTVVFELLKEKFGFCPPWGSLTGIRPTRLIYESLENGLSLTEAKNRLISEFYVSPDKAELLTEIIEMQRGFIFPPADSFDLYIHIPFCASRCAYCSFATEVVGKGKMTEPYTLALLKELKDSAEIISSLGLKIRAGYVGGGTPTAISVNQLERVLDCAMTLFPGAVEWTVEAGRPDTIDAEKLKILKDMKVERISVNPQSFSDDTLKRIGRAHSASDTIKAFELARSMGFNHINMDLIAALPGENISDFGRTLDKVIELDPESVTVHSLAIKRSSRLHEQLTVAGDSHNQAKVEDADKMIGTARARLGLSGYKPYYLYRQKYMAGNLENVGYAKDGYQCLYNIGNMEETQRVMAVGAGAITKWIFDRERRIERAPNLRNIEQYIERVDEMGARKREIIFGSDKA